MRALPRWGDAIVVLTERPQFRGLDGNMLAARMAADLVVTTRDLLDDDVLRRAGPTSHRLG